jgi:ABC-type ATPase with predicted acetyltransferase domain
VLLDEFASVLDRAAARSLTLSLTRRARLEGVRLVLASAHDDVRDWAAPEVEVRLALDGGVHLDGC